MIIGIGSFRGLRPSNITNSPSLIKGEGSQINIKGGGVNKKSLTLPLDKIASLEYSLALDALRWTKV